MEYTWQQQRRQRQRSRKQKSQSKRRQRRRNNLHITLRHFLTDFYEPFRTDALQDIILKTASCTFNFPQTFFGFPTNPGSVQTGVKTAYPDVQCACSSISWVLEELFFRSRPVIKIRFLVKRSRKHQHGLKKACAHIDFPPSKRMIQSIHHE